MHAMFIRYLLLVAVALMPFGMASAASRHAHEMPRAAMPMEHCPDKSDADHQSKAGIAACTMACAGALPAADLADHLKLAMARPALTVLGPHPLSGLHPDTLTPPPKRA